MRRCVSCERGVWTSGAFSFMCARIRGVITFVKSWGGGGAKRCVWCGHEKTPLVPCGYRGVGWVLLCECALCEVGVAGGGH